MMGKFHFIVFLAGAIGFAVTFLIDLDHYTTSGENTWKCRWAGFTGNNFDAPECSTMSRSFLHNPVVMLSMSAFFLMIGIGLFFHYIMDFVVVP